MLVVGNAVSTLGNAVYLVAVLLLLKELTESAFVMGLFQFVAIAPGFFLSPVTGTLVDRMSRRTVIIVADLFRGLVMIVASGLLLLPATRGAIVVLVAATCIGIGNAFFVPAVQALIPSLVPPSKLPWANGVRAGGTQLFNLAGNAAGGLLYALLGAPLLFLINGASFVLSALQESFIRTDASARGAAAAGAPATRVAAPHAAATAVATGTVDRSAGGVREQAREGLRVVAGAPRLRRAIVSQAGLFVLSPVLLLSLPFIVIDELGLPQATLGYVFAAALAGGILAFVVLGRRGRPDRTGARIPRIGYAITSLALAGLAVSSTLPLVVAAAVVVGAASAAVYLHAITMIQREYDRAIHGRLFAILEAVTSLVGPISFVVTGVLLDLLGPDRRAVLFAIAAAAAAVWALAMWIADRPG